MFQFFNEDQSMLKKLIGEFAQREIAPHAAEWDEQDRCPTELWPTLGEMGMLGVFVPTQYGGSGLGLTERAIILSEVSRFSAGLGIAMMTHDLAVAAILNFGTEEQKQQYLPDMLKGKKIGGLSVTEPTGGSDFGNQNTTIERQGDNYVINGRKCFITNSHITHVNVITGTCGVNEKGRKLISAVIVPSETQGWKPGRKEHKLGLRGSVTGEIVCDNVVVPANAILGKDGDGSKVAMHTIGHFGRSGMAAIALGVLKACSEQSISFAKQRIVYGKPLAAVQAIQLSIAQTLVDSDAAESMLYNATTVYDHGEQCIPQIAGVKLFASQAAIRAAQRTIDIMGGYGVINEYPAGRYLRDAMAIVPSGGTSQIMAIIVAGAACK